MSEGKKAKGLLNSPGACQGKGSAEEQGNRGPGGPPVWGGLTQNLPGWSWPLDSLQEARNCKGHSLCPHLTLRSSLRARFWVIFLSLISCLLGDILSLHGFQWIEQVLMRRRSGVANHHGLVIHSPDCTTSWAPAVSNLAAHWSHPGRVKESQ